MSGRKLAYLVIAISLAALIIFLLGCTPEYEIEVQVDPEEAGEIIGEGTYEEGDEVTVEAEPKEEYEFVRWEKDDNKVHEDQTYSFEIEQDTDLSAKFDEKEYKIMQELNPDSTFEFGQKPELTDVLVYDDVMFYFHHISDDESPFGELYFQGNDINSKETVIKEKIDDHFDIGHNTSPSLSQYDDLLIVKHDGQRGVSSHGVIAYDIKSLEEVYRRQTKDVGHVFVENDYFYKRAYNGNEEDPVYKKYSLETGGKVGFNLN